MSGSQYIDTCVEGSLLKIGIKRPEKKNAITSDMYNAIRVALSQADDNDAIKVVLFYGTESVFSAGNDLADFNNREPNKTSPAGEMLLVLSNFKKPIVAAVSGLAVGIGATLLLHCDIVYATPETRFRMPFTNLGVCPEAGSSLLLPMTAGLRKASEILLLGNFFSTEKAIEIGIVNEPVEADNLIEHALGTAFTIAQKPTRAVLETKRLLKEGYRQSLNDRMEEEFTLFAALLQSPESVAARKQALNPDG